MTREAGLAPARGLAALAWVALLAASVQAQEPDAQGALDFESGFADFAVEPLPHHHPDQAVDITEIEPEREPVAGEVIEYLGRGHASYYGRRFAGRPTASGEVFNPRDLTAAHRTLPFGSMVRVTNRSNGRSVVVRINDRGPFVEGREIELSRAAAKEIRLLSRGVGEVDLELLAS